MLFPTTFKIIYIDKMFVKTSRIKDIRAVVLNLGRWGIIDPSAMVLIKALDPLLSQMHTRLHAPMQTVGFKM